MKKVIAILLALVLCMAVIACGGEDTPATPTPQPTPQQPGDPDPPPPPPTPQPGLENVTLTLWGGEYDQNMLRSMADAFIALHANEANITINLGVESESTAKDTILTDVQAAADVFAFPDDQLMELYLAGVLQEVLLNTNDIIAANAAGSVEAATVDGKLYAYPMTADNGYFMFYDSSYFSAADVQSFDKMMEVAAAAGKRITMDFGSGWYTIAFFRAKGLDAWLEADSVSTGTNLNGPGGADVVQAMIDIAKNPGFIALGGDEFITGINDGSIIAGVGGPWWSGDAAGAWGGNYAATKLPTYTVAGSQVQMGGVLGSKFVGVNAFSEYVGYAMLLAEWITNYENQVLRFETVGQGPSNIQAAASPAVQANHALAAMAAQANYSGFFNPGGSYWDPMGTLGAIIAQGNPDNTDPQVLIDNAVNGMR